MDRPVFDDVCHVFSDPEPNRGDWNMAVDELLLEAAVERGQCSVRLYRWAEPTISLGYFQRPDDVPETLRAAGLPIVRRPSGGGAILHHHELTYACAIPARHPLARFPKELYLRVHERMIQVLTELGIRLRLRGTNSDERSRAFLCFARSDSFDVIMADGHKVIGSAQRRRRGAILQHGSLVLARSEFVPEFPGVQELANQLLCGDELSARLGRSLASLLRRNTVTAKLLSADRRRIRERLRRETIGDPSF